MSKHEPASAVATDEERGCVRIRKPYAYAASVCEPGVPVALIAKAYEDGVQAALKCVKSLNAHIRREFHGCAESITGEKQRRSNPIFAAYAEALVERITADLNTSEEVPA